MNEEILAGASVVEDFMTRMLYFGLRPKVAVLSDGETLEWMKPQMVGEKMDVRGFRVHWDKSRELCSLLPTLDASDCDVVVVASMRPFRGCLEDDEVVAAFARMKTLTVVAMGGVAPRMERCADYDLVVVERLVDCLNGLSSKDAVSRPEYMVATDKRLETLMEKEVTRRMQLAKSEWDKERESLLVQQKELEDCCADMESERKSMEEREIGLRKQIRRRDTWIWVLGLVAALGFIFAVMGVLYFVICLGGELTGLCR